jgi:hypothetical protein
MFKFVGCTMCPYIRLWSLVDNYINYHVVLIILKSSSDCLIDHGNSAKIKLIDKLHSLGKEWKSSKIIFISLTMRPEVSEGLAEKTRRN